MVNIQDFVIWIRWFHCSCKNMIFDTRFDTSTFELYRSLPKEKNIKVIGLMKDELDVQVMKEFDGLRPKNIAI